MDYPFKTEPFDHQREAFEKTRDLKAYGIFWEQRCGKTKLAIDTGTHLFLKKEIDAFLIVAPPGVQLNWILDEIPLHMPTIAFERCRMHCYESKRAKTVKHKKAVEYLINHQGLAVLAMSFQAFMTEQGKETAKQFVKFRKVFYVVDECHHIKTPDAARTKSMLASSKYAPYKRVLTGTPASEGPFDVYAPIKFLDGNFWKFRGMDDFGAFKTHYGQWITNRFFNKKTGREQEYPMCVKFRNLPELQTLLGTISHRVTQDQVLKLPPALYSKRYFEMTPRQADLYHRLKNEFEVEIEAGKFVTAQLAIVRYGRLQQIASGYVPDENGDPHSTVEKDSLDPRLELLKDVLDECPGQTVIFCQYRHDVTRILNLLGPRCARYDGAVSDTEGAENLHRFKAGEVPYMAVTFARGSEGLNMASAQTWIGYSHTIKLRERSQAEERIKAPGQTTHRNYIDLIGRETVDEKIVAALRDKRDVSAQITGDTLKEWL